MKYRQLVMYFISSMLLVGLVAVGVAGAGAVNNNNLDLNGGSFKITVTQWIDAQFNQPSDTASTVVVTDYNEDFSNVPPYNAGWEIIYLYSNAPNVRLKAEADFGGNTTVVDNNLNSLKLDVYDSQSNPYPSTGSNQVGIEIIGGSHFTTAGILTLKAGSYDSQDGKTYRLGISVNAKSTMPAGWYHATLNLILMPDTNL